jgi:hypothetical protein
VAVVVTPRRPLATLGRVQWSARLALAALLFAALGPSLARAQEDTSDGPPVDGPGYEPDQRGVVEPQQPPAVEPQSLERREQIAAEPGSADAEIAGEYAASGSRFGLELAIDLGAALTALDSAGQSNLVRSTQEGSVGAAIGVRAGFRIGPASFGPHIAMILDPSFILANLGIGVHVMLLPEEIAPFVSFALGATIVSNLGDALPAQEGTGIFGIGAELGGGVRWQSRDGLILGGEAAAGWHHLWRDGVACEGECTDGDFDVRDPGESDALTLRLSLFAGYAFR